MIYVDTKKIIYNGQTIAPNIKRSDWIKRLKDKQKEILKDYIILEEI